METFFCQEDYRAYVSLLVTWCGRFGIRIWAYCLMPNHVHLVAVPQTQEGLARGIGETHRRYTRRINFREGWRGHLWQGRFTSFIMDEPYLLPATRYVERNPVQASLVGEAWDWPWSSAAAHVAGRGDAVAEGAWLEDRITGRVCTWREYLGGGDEPGLAADIRSRESTGRPLGDQSFVKQLGVLLARNLLPKIPGPRPKHNH